MSQFLYHDYYEYILPYLLQYRPINSYRYSIQYIFCVAISSTLSFPLFLFKMMSKTRNIWKSTVQICGLDWIGYISLYRGFIRKTMWRHASTRRYCLVVSHTYTQHARRAQYNEAPLRSRYKTQWATLCIPIFAYISNSCNIYMEHGAKVKFTLRYAIVVVFAVRPAREWEGETLNKTENKYRAMPSFAMLCSQCECERALIVPLCLPPVLVWIWVFFVVRVCSCKQ